MTWYYGQCKTDSSQYGFYRNSSECNNAVVVTDADHDNLIGGCTCGKRISPNGDGYPILTNDGYIDDNIVEFEPKWIDVSNVVVSNWVANTYTTQRGIKQFDYMAVIAVAGVTARTMCMVEFADEQAYSGNYCNSCISSAGTVTIFSKSNTAITLNRIIGKV